MKKLDVEEMKKIEGGTNLSATLVGAVSKVIETIYNLGDALGSTIRRLIENNKCEF